MYIFYDGPTPPDGIFDEYLAIPALLKDKKPSFTDIMIITASAIAGVSGGHR